MRRPARHRGGAENAAPDAVPIMRAHLRTVANRSMVPAARAPPPRSIRFKRSRWNAPDCSAWDRRVRASSVEPVPPRRDRSRNTPSRWPKQPRPGNGRCPPGGGRRSPRSTGYDARHRPRHPLPGFGHEGGCHRRGAHLLHPRSSPQVVAPLGAGRQPVAPPVFADHRRPAPLGVGQQRITDPLWWDKALAPGSAAAGRAMEQTLDEWAAFRRRTITRAAHRRAGRQQWNHADHPRQLMRAAGTTDDRNKVDVSGEPAGRAMAQPVGISEFGGP